MSRSVWRIATDTKTYEADDLSGMGAQETGGRWNAAGDHLVDTSVIVPDEYNVLISALHPNRRVIVAVKIRNFLYDPRLMQQA